MYVVFTSITVTHAYSTIGVCLLWTIGIAHCDISLYEIMADNGQDCKIIGILHDFNLAMIMGPRNHNPSKMGWERTGTLPFMALDLLKYHDGQCKRRYRHDLESSAWCFAFLISTTNLSTWFNGSHDEICRAKLSFRHYMSKYKTHAVWEDYRKFALEWIEKWLDLDALRDKVIRDLNDEDQIAKFTEEDMKTKDKAYIEDAVKEAAK